MTLRLQNRVADRRIKEPKRLLAKRLARTKDKTLSERWYSPMVESPSQSASPSEQGISSPQPSVIKGYANIIAHAMELPIAANSIYEMPPHEAQRFRQQLYAINAKGKYHWYTRYLEQKYLMVWRMK